jgi:hypothetical protein
MNAEYSMYSEREQFVKPDHISDEEWFAIDLSDPLMMVC